jgi:hypothetical protein
MPSPPKGKSPGALGERNRARKFGRAGAPPRTNKGRREGLAFLVDRGGRRPHDGQRNSVQALVRVKDEYPSRCRSPNAVVLRCPAGQANTPGRWAWFGRKGAEHRDLM